MQDVIGEQHKGRLSLIHQPLLIAGFSILETPILDSTTFNKLNKQN